MEWGWLQSLIYGLLSGITEFLPISAETHQLLFRELTGLEAPGAVIHLAVSLGALAALLVGCRKRLKKLRQERRIAAVPPKKRKRQPDAAALMDLRLLRVAVIPLLLSLAAEWYLSGKLEKLWLAAILAAANGVIVYLPLHMPQANKESRSLSALDSLLVGLGGALGAVPGISRIGALTAVGRARGMDRQYGLEFSLLLLLPVLLVLCVLDGVALAAPGAQAVTAEMLVNAAAACVGAFLAASVGIQSMRFLSVKAGFTGFAYYSWGISMVLLILYLIV